MFMVVSFPWSVPSANIELTGPWLPRQDRWARRSRTVCRTPMHRPGSSLMVGRHAWKCCRFLCWGSRS